jgi:hypothetical protein
MKRIICILTLTLVAAAAGFADIPRAEKTAKPQQQKGIETNLSIRLDSNAKEARLLIPKSELKQLRAQLDNMDDDADNTAAVTGFGRTQTIVSGMFLSLAIVFGGIWFVRSGKGSTRTGKALVIGAMLAGVGSAATFVYANAGPPAEARSITGKMFSQSVHFYNFGYGSVKLESKNEDRGGIELIVPNPKDDKPNP